MFTKENISTGITKEQCEYLKTFHCERLSNNEINNELIIDFACKRNSSLVDVLQNSAWHDDETGAEAHYIVKNDSGKVALYFALKTGCLFSHIYTPEELLDEIKKLLQNAFGITEYSTIEEGIDKAINTKGNKKGKNILYKKYYQYLDQKSSGINLKAKTISSIKVTQTFPSIELSIFCKNDYINNFWEHDLIPYPIGVVLFWSFVVDVIEQARKYIGFQYLFLFAADNSNDSSLIAYYKESFKMQAFDAGQMIIKKPEFDFLCTPLYCEVNSLFENKKLFFEHFNEVNIK